MITVYSIGRELTLTLILTFQDVKIRITILTLYVSSLKSVLGISDKIPIINLTMIPGLTFLQINFLRLFSLRHPLTVCTMIISAVFKAAKQGTNAKISRKRE